MGRLAPKGNYFLVIGRPAFPSRPGLPFPEAFAGRSSSNIWSSLLVPVLRCPYQVMIVLGTANFWLETCRSAHVLHLHIIRPHRDVGCGLSNLRVLIVIEHISNILFGGRSSSVKGDWPATSCCSSSSQRKAISSTSFLQRGLACDEDLDIQGGSYFFPTSGPWYSKSIIHSSSVSFFHWHPLTVCLMQRSESAIVSEGSCLKSAK